jgi:hypothetical protein
MVLHLYLGLLEASWNVIFGQATLWRIVGPGFDVHAVVHPKAIDFLGPGTRAFSCLPQLVWCLVEPNKAEEWLYTVI